MGERTRRGNGGPTRRSAWPRHSGAFAGGAHVCKADRMRIGILGGTGPAGSALAARLASVGYDAVIGSRSKYRAMEARDSLVEKWPDLAPRLSYGDNAAAAGCDIVVIATPWDSAATTAQENAAALAGRVTRAGRHFS